MLIINYYFPKYVIYKIIYKYTSKIEKNKRFYFFVRNLIYKSNALFCSKCGKFLSAGNKSDMTKQTIIEIFDKISNLLRNSSFIHICLISPLLSSRG